jgi:hypothetical protein
VARARADGRAEEEKKTDVETSMKTRDCRDETAEEEMERIFRVTNRTEM